MIYDCNRINDYKTLRKAVKDNFKQDNKILSSLNEFNEWKAKINKNKYNGQPSMDALRIMNEMQCSVIKEVEPHSKAYSCPMDNPFEEGLAVTINFHDKHNNNKLLMADDYQKDVFKIIHIFRDSLMHHVRVFTVGCFEVDRKGLLHVHFILYGRKLRMLREEEVYAYHKAIKFITAQVLPRDDVLVEKVRDIGFFKYILKNVKDAKTSECFFNYFAHKVKKISDRS